MEYENSVKTRKGMKEQIRHIREQLDRKGVYTPKEYDYNYDTGKKFGKGVTMDFDEAMRYLNRLNAKHDRLENMTFPYRHHTNLFARMAAAIMRAGIFIAEQIKERIDETIMRRDPIYKEQVQAYRDLGLAREDVQKAVDEAAKEAAKEASKKEQEKGSKEKKAENKGEREKSREKNQKAAEDKEQKADPFDVKSKENVFEIDPSEADPFARKEEAFVPPEKKDMDAAKEDLLVAMRSGDAKKEQDQYVRAADMYLKEFEEKVTAFEEREGKKDGYEHQAFEEGKREIFGTFEDFVRNGTVDLDQKMTEMLKQNGYDSPEIALLAAVTKNDMRYLYEYGEQFTEGLRELPAKDIAEAFYEVASEEGKIPKNMINEQRKEVMLDMHPHKSLIESERALQGIHQARVLLHAKNKTPELTEFAQKDYLDAHIRYVDLLKSAYKDLPKDIEDRLTYEQSHEGLIKDQYRNLEEEVRMGNIPLNRDVSELVKRDAHEMAVDFAASSIIRNKDLNDCALIPLMSEHGEAESNTILAEKIMEKARDKDEILETIPLLIAQGQLSGYDKDMQEVASELRVRLSGEFDVIETSNMIGEAERALSDVEILTEQAKEEDQRFLEDDLELAM